MATQPVYQARHFRKGDAPIGPVAVNYSGRPEFYHPAASPHIEALAAMMAEVIRARLEHDAEFVFRRDEALNEAQAVADRISREVAYAMRDTASREMDAARNIAAAAVFTHLGGREDGE